MLPAPEEKLTPVESKFGKALIAYLSSNTNAHTSFLKQYVRFVESHPREKVSLKPNKSIAVLTMLYGREPYETTALINYSFGIALYATEEPFLREVREQMVAAIKKRKRSDITMEGQVVDTIRVTNQMRILRDKETSLEMSEVEILVRLAAV